MLLRHIFCIIKLNILADFPLISGIKLQHCHNKVYKYLSPRNIIVNDGFKLKLISDISEDEPLPPWHFFAPEVTLKGNDGCGSSDSVTASADIFSVGQIILWLSCLTKDNTSPTEKIFKGLAEMPILGNIISSDPLKRPTIDDLTNYEWFGFKIVTEKEKDYYSEEPHKPDEYILRTLSPEEEEIMNEMDDTAESESNCVGVYKNAKNEQKNRSDYREQEFRTLHQTSPSSSVFGVGPLLKRLPEVEALKGSRDSQPNLTKEDKSAVNEEVQSILNSMYGSDSSSDRSSHSVPDNS